MTPKKIAARFHAMLKEKEGEYGRGFNKYLNYKTGISTGYLSEILAGDKPGSQETQMKICEAIDFDYNKLLIEDTDTPPSNNITTIEHAHVKVIQQFQQKELALEINQIMLEIEKNNPALLKMIKSQLSGLANECYPAPQKKRTPGSKKA